MSLSSSSSNIQIVSGEQFRKHFQEDKFGPQRKIEIIDTNNKPNAPITQYFDKLISQKSNKIDYDKCFENFFVNNNNINNNANFNNNININVNKDNINKNKTVNKQAKNNYILNSPQSTNKKKKIIPKRKKFSPLPKNKYKKNNINHKLIINDLEKQILTDIYDQYSNKDEFEETYYYLDKIKYIINQKGVEEAMNYLETIEPESLRTKIIMESTFFFKEIIKEEIEFAENNEGKLLLYKQPDNIVFNQNIKFITSLNGKVDNNKKNNKEVKNKNLLNKKNNYCYSNVNNINNNDFHYTNIYDNSKKNKNK